LEGVAGDQLQPRVVDELGHASWRLGGGWRDDDGDTVEDVEEGVELVGGEDDDGAAATIGVEVLGLFEEGWEGVATGPADAPVAGGLLIEEGESTAGLLGVGHVVGFEGADFGADDGLAVGLELLDDEAVS
jgi:hypothetical protein